MKKVTRKDTTLYIEFRVPTAQFYTTLKQVKSLKGVFFNGATKQWSVPFSEEALTKLRGWGFEIAIEEPKVAIPFVAVTPRKAVDRSKLSDKLRPYQIEAIEFMEATNWRGFISLAPRLGKSACALAGNILHPEMTPTLIICPASVKIGWKQEIKKWEHSRSVHIIEGMTPYLLPEKEFYIINYDILYDWMHSLPAFQYIILDESHRVSNTRTSKKGDDDKYIPVQCTLAFQHLARSVPHIALLSGTPITSKIWQLWVGLNVLSPNRFPNEYSFKWRYCAPHKNEYGWVFDGLSNAEELYARIQRFMYRRTREEVFTDLPEEQHEFIHVELNAREFEADLRGFKKWYSTHKDVNDEELEEKLSSFSSLDYSKKRSYIIDWLSDFLESNEQIVVFAWHRDVVEDLHHVFKKKSTILYGGMSGKKKQKAIDDFNAGQVQMFIANISAAKEGITLASASTVAFVEFPRTAGDLEQASLRIWLPEKHNKLNYVYFVAAELEEARIDTLRARARMLHKALDGKDQEIFVDRVRQYLEQ